MELSPTKFSFLRNLLQMYSAKDFKTQMGFHPIHRNLQHGRPCVNHVAIFSKLKEWQENGDSSNWETVEALMSTIQSDKCSPTFQWTQPAKGDLSQFISLHNLLLKRSSSWWECGVAPSSNRKSMWALTLLLKAAGWHWKFLDLCPCPFEMLCTRVLTCTVFWRHRGWTPSAILHCEVLALSWVYPRVNPADKLGKYVKCTAWNGNFQGRMT